MPPTSDEEALGLLEAEGLLKRDAACYRTTRRWQAAMSRAAWQLLCAGDDGRGGDLRAPIALALLELRGELPDEDTARFVEVLLPIEARELDPLLHEDPPSDRSERADALHR